jgi:hypothetical protein
MTNTVNQSHSQPPSRTASQSVGQPVSQPPTCIASLTRSVLTPGAPLYSFTIFLRNHQPQVEMLYHTH